jgi:hypothetical protein
MTGRQHFRQAEIYVERIEAVLSGEMGFPVETASLDLLLRLTQTHISLAEIASIVGGEE